MGYRSKVIIGVKEEKANELDAILIKHNYRPEKSNDFLKIDDVNGYKTYIFPYVKWYSWSKEIEDWLDATQFNELDSCWCVGIGEEGELHSEIGDYWDFVDIIRDINLKHQKH